MKKYFFLILLLFFSYSAFATIPGTCNGTESAVCASWNHNCGFYSSNYPLNFKPEGVSDPDIGFLCSVQLACPQNSTLGPGTGTCGCKSGFSEVNGACVPDQTSSSSSSSSSLPCDWTETCSSSSSSASSCVSGFIPAVINGNSTCVPDLNPSSSSAASTSNSASSAASASSSPSSSGSASSSASVDNSGGNNGGSGGNGGGNSSSGTGGTGGSGGDGSGSNSSGSSVGLSQMQNCELTFGAGHCLAISGDSPCPNKYTFGDKTYCVSMASNGTGQGSGSASSGAASSTPAECDPEKKGYLACQEISGVHVPSSGDKGSFNDQKVNQMIADAQGELRTKLDGIKNEMNGMFNLNLNTSSSLVDQCSDIRGANVCFGFAKFKDYIAAIPQGILVLAYLAAFIIVIRRTA